MHKFSDEYQKSSKLLEMLFKTIFTNIQDKLATYLKKNMNRAAVMQNKRTYKKEKECYYIKHHTTTACSGS